MGNRTKLFIFVLYTIYVAICVIYLLMGMMKKIDVSDTNIKIIFIFGILLTILMGELLLPKKNK
jgi:K+-sensing histidine kinase KdpD